MSYKKIMVALCGRGDEQEIIREAVTLAEIHGAKLTAIHVNDPHAGEMSMMMDNPELKYKEEDVCQWFREAGFEDVASGLEVNVISARSVQKAICSNTEGVDLLILGHRRLNFFKENFFDSVDEGIVNHVSCPVLVIPKN